MLMNVLLSVFLFVSVGLFVCFVFWVFLAAPHGMQDLSSPIRDRTCAPCSGSMES